MVRKISPLRLGIIIAALVLIVFAGYAGVKYTMAYLFPDAWEEEDPDEIEDPLPPDQMNLLLLGIDARKGETVARADSIIFAHADTGARTVALMSIPRDTRVEIPRRGMDKINAATVYGGPDLARKVVSELLGVPVPYYVAVDFEGFKGVVDILGGVTIDVDDRMYYRDPRDTPPLVIDLYPGEQRLDAEQAMGYVRYRSDGLADISRTQRQQKFMMALAKEMMQPKTILKLPKLIPELKKNIDTNLSLKKMVKWAGMAKKLDGLEMVSATLPGTFWDSGGASYWYVDPDRAKVAYADLIAGNPITGPIDPNVRPPTPVAPPEPPPVYIEEEPDGPAWSGEPGDGDRHEYELPPAEEILPPVGVPTPESEPPPEVPGWTPVDEGPDHHHRPGPGAGVEYGALSDDSLVVGG